MGGILYLRSQFLSLLEQLLGARKDGINFRIGRRIPKLNGIFVPQETLKTQCLVRVRLEEDRGGSSQSCHNRRMIAAREKQFSTCEDSRPHQDGGAHRDEGHVRSTRHSFQELIAPTRRNQIYRIPEQLQLFDEGDVAVGRSVRVPGRSRSSRHTYVRLIETKRTEPMGRFAPVRENKIPSRRNGPCGFVDVRIPGEEAIRDKSWL
jgi:hypothetical protein